MRRIDVIKWCELLNLNFSAYVLVVEVQYKMGVEDRGSNQGAQKVFIESRDKSYSLR